MSLRADRTSFPGAGKSQRRKERAGNKALRKAIATGEVDLKMSDATEAAGALGKDEPATAAAFMQQ